MMRKYLKRFFIGLTSIFLLICLITGALLIFIQTSSGQKLIVSKLNDILHWDDGQVVLEGLSGRVPFNMTLDRVDIKDEQGDWLVVEDVELNWSFARLLSREFHIFNVGADRVIFNRLPEYEGSEVDPEDREPLQIKWQWPLPPLTVEKIFLNDVYISEAVMEHELHFDALGSLYADRKGFSVANLKVNRLDEPSSLIDLNAELRRDPYNLDIDLTAFDPGILPALVGLENWPENTSLSIQGAGVLNAWTCRVEIDGQDMFHAGLDLWIEERDFYVLHGDGEIYVNPALIPEEGMGFTEDPFSVLFSAGINDYDALIFDNFNIQSSTLELNAAGSFKPDDLSVEAAADLMVFDINPLLKGSGLTIDKPVELHAVLSGPVSKIRVDADLLVHEFAGHGTMFSQAVLDGVFNLNPEQGVMAGAEGGIILSGLALDDYAQMPEMVNVDFDLHYSDADTVVIRYLNINADNFSSSARGSFNADKLDFKAEARMDIKKVQNFIPGMGDEPFFETDLGLDLDASGNIEKGIYQAKLSFLFSDFTSTDSALNTLTGNQPTLDIETIFDQDMKLEIRQATVRGAEFNADLSGMADFEYQNIDLAAKIAVPSLHNLGKALNLNLGGEFLSDISVQGTLDLPEIELLATVNHLVYEDLEPMDVQALIVADIVDTEPHGWIDIAISQHEKTLGVYSGYFFEGQKASLRNLTADGPGFSLSGYAEYDMASGLADGDVAVSLFSLEELGAFFNTAIQGNVQSRIQLIPANDNQNVHFYLSGEEIRFAEFSLDTVTTSGTIEDIFSALTVESELDLQGFTSPQASLDSLALNLSGHLEQVSFAADASGYAAHPFDVQLEGQYSSPGQSMHNLELSKLDGRFAHEPLLLESPLKLSFADDNITLEPTQLRFGSGVADLDLEFRPQGINSNISLKGLQLSELPLDAVHFMLGEINLDLQLTGPPESPVASLELLLSNLAPAAANMEVPFTLTMTSNIRMQEGDLDMQARLMDEDKEMLAVHVDIPMHLSLEPFALDMPDPLPLNGSVDSKLDLVKLALIFLPPDQTLSGFLLSDLKIAGSVTEPDIKGHLRLEDSFFEHLDAGLLLADITLDAFLDGTSLQIESLTATDGISGKIMGSGSLDFHPSGEMPWSFSVDMQDFRLLNQRLAVVNIDDGDLALTGGKSQADVSGKIVFDGIEINLPGPSPPGVVDLHVVTEINHPQAREETITTRPGAEFPVTLDIALEFPSRVFVRGRGLDSEWGGGLTITGKAEAPEIRGELQVQRGRLLLLDRRFDLERDSIIHLDGSYPPDPGVDIEAYLRQRDKMIHVHVYGPALDPEIVFSSDPPMPEDEILAWILFGRDLSTLTPFQAVALADSARTLAMGSSGPGVMDQVRSFIGVDDIDVTRDEEGHTQFGMGKYVHERVYVEVKKGTSPGGDEVAVQIELSPRFSLESNVDSDSEGGVMLFWKYDY